MFEMIVMFAAASLVSAVAVVVMVDVADEKATVTVTAIHAHFSVMK
jgi:hypothetical protein